MKKSVEIEAATVDQAVDMALIELNAKKEDVEIEVLNNSNLFQQAKVKVTVNENYAEELKEFMNGILEKMGLSSRADAVEENGTITVSISGKDSSIAIGYRGETLDAFQYLALTFLNEKKGTDKKIVVDCEDYRSKRKETLSALAEKLAEKANRLARKIALEPMNPFERRIIHNALADSAIATTVSEGEEPNRYVIIIPTVVELKDEKPLKNGAREDKNHQRSGKKNFKGKNNQKKRTENDEEVADGKVYRGYYTSDETFTKTQPQGGPPKFKSFGGNKKF